MVSQNKKVVYRKLFCWLTISNFLYIIVLLILAAISISTLTGENGILSKASKAKEETEREDIIEQAKIDVLGILADNTGKITQEQFNTILEKYDKEGKSDKNNEEGEGIIETENNYTIKTSEIYDGNFYEPEKKRVFYMGTFEIDYKEGMKWDNDFINEMGSWIWDNDPFGNGNTLDRLMVLSYSENGIAWCSRDEDIFYLELDGEKVFYEDKVKEGGHYTFNFGV